MTYTIKDNNGNIIFSVENTNIITPNISYESINNELKDINDYSNKLYKSIEAYNLISDTRAMEAFGYMTTEGFKDNIKKVGHNIWEKIKKICEKIVGAIKSALSFVKNLIVKIKNAALKQYAKIGAKIIASALADYKRHNNTLDTVSKNNAKESIIKLIESDKMATFVIVYKNFKIYLKLNDILVDNIEKLTKGKGKKESLSILAKETDGIYLSESKYLDLMDIDRLEKTVSFGEKVSVALKFFEDIESERYDLVFLPFASKSIDALTESENTFKNFLNTYSEYKDNENVNKILSYISKELSIYPKLMQILLKFISVSSDMYNIAIAAGKKENNKSE